MGEQEATMDDMVTEEEGSGSDEESAPSELAKSLREHRPSDTATNPTQAPRPRQR